MRNKAVCTGGKITLNTRQEKTTENTVEITDL